jgi:hypothetical protein
MRIGLTGIVVDDQDNNAERFYTQVLGLKAKTNAPYAAPDAGRPWCPCDLVGGWVSGIGRWPRRLG